MRFLLLFLCSAWSLAAQQPSESNVVFGMYSGLALVMDVYKPTGAANG